MTRLIVGVDLATKDGDQTVEIIRCTGCDLFVANGVIMNNGDPNCDHGRKAEVRIGS